MKRIQIAPVLAAVMLAAACDSPAEVDTRASVRFFNATTGASSATAFTINGQSVSGSSLAFAQSSATCTKVDQGSTSFGFGGVSLTGQAITDGGDYTLIAAGPAANPSLFLLNNTYSAGLAANQAAVRFVNLAPGSDATPHTFFVYNGVIGQGDQLGKNMVFGVATSFSTVASGSHQFSVLKLPGLVFAIEGTPATFTVASGSANTFAILPTSSGGWQEINIPHCS